METQYNEQALPPKKGTDTVSDKELEIENGFFAVEKSDEPDNLKKEEVNLKNELKDEVINSGASTDTFDAAVNSTMEIGSNNYADDNTINSEEEN